MKAEELMIGDWVMYNPNVFIEDEYEPTKECYPTRISNGADIDLAIENCYAPIPLTEEILKKNGFVDCNTIGEKFELRIYLDKDNYQVVSYYFGLTALSIKTEYSYYLSPTIDRLRIKYVHELQHALRLCKIDKEIEL